MKQTSDDEKDCTVGFSRSKRVGFDPSTYFTGHLLTKVPKWDDLAQKWPRKYFFLTMDMGRAGLRPPT